MRRVAAVVSALAVTALVADARQKPSVAKLKTTAEASGFKSTSTYDDVVRFMKAVDDASPVIFYTTYGTTHEGRAMPMAVVGTGLKDPSAAAVRATGKLRVHIQGNIHAGEVEGKESAQILLREFALGQHKDWLQSTVFLITPILNADGNEKFAVNNRQRQNGPINGMGTRPNAQGLNINRDFMKLDTPEARAFVKLWVDYDPHAGFDLHTSDGSFHGYYLTYSPPLNPNTSDAITTVMKGEWFPFVTRNIKTKHGWDTFYYGNVSTPGGRGRGRGGEPPSPPATPPAPQPTGPPEWRTFEHVPRFHNSYVGMRNRFALLSEAYAYATFEDRIKATNYFMEEALNFAHANAPRLKKLALDADREKIAGRTLATSARIKRGGMIEILMGEVEDETNPVSGAVMNRRKNVVKPQQMVDMLWFEAAATEVVPSAYYVPATATKAVELLKAHGIQMREAALPGGTEEFAISANTAGQTFEGHTLRRLEGKWGVTSGGNPSGKYLEVRTDQPLGRLAFYLLEPTSDDGLVAWNFLDAELKDVATGPYPIVRRK
ncbi:MAG TPA: M14 family zinc carboxypeptidase [Vicinamibacterales bacterium]|nr:M14 family zinc carboxypeptidase [Vicinamibacterales bacterium]